MSTEVEPPAVRQDPAARRPVPAATEGLLERIVAWAAEGVGSDDGFISLVEPGEEDLILRVGTGLYADLVGLRVTRGEGLMGRVWESGRPQSVSDYSRWEHRVRSLDGKPFRATLGVPLRSGCVVTGVIGLTFTDRERTFSDEQVEQVSRFAELASVALDNARLYAAAEQELAERARAEEQLRAAEMRFRTLVEQIPAIVYSEEFKVGGSRQYVNRHVEVLFGVTPEQAAEENSWKSFVHPDDLERVLAEEARCEETGEPFAMEYRLFTADGQVRWMRDQCVIVRDTDGTPLFWQGVSVDVTDIKVAEAATRDALEREREAAARLRNLDVMKNTFLDAVSHELRTPLTSVLGIAHTLQRAGGELDEATRADLVARLLANGSKLDRLLSDLLDLDRLSLGLVEPERHPTDIAGLVGRIAAEWRLLNGRELEVDAEPVTVCLDAGKLERIVENLLANAARHTPPDARVWVRVRQARDGVLVAVEDAGAGVPSEVRSTVFEPFRRGPDAPLHAPGVGIGLSLVARFAELHGGRAWVEERPGGGSSFRVFIPDGPRR